MRTERRDGEDIHSTPKDSFHRRKEQSQRVASRRTLQSVLCHGTEEMRTRTSTSAEKKRSQKTGNIKQRRQATYSALVEAKGCRVEVATILPQGRITNRKVNLKKQIKIERAHRGETKEEEEGQTQQKGKKETSVEKCGREI